MNNGAIFKHVQKFGIEIEVYFPQEFFHQYGSMGSRFQRAAEALNEAARALFGNNNANRPFFHTDCEIGGVWVWGVVADGSVYEGCEIVSPILDLNDPESYEQLSMVYACLNHLGYRVHEKCGTHVHVDMKTWMDSNNLSEAERSQFFFLLGKMYGKKEDTHFNKFVKANRLNNAYTKSMNSPGWDIHSYSRYWNVNVQAFHKHGTVEYRQLQGNIRADVGIAWVKLVSTFSENVVNFFLEAREKNKKKKIQS